MRITGTPLSSWLQRLVGWSPVRGPASRAESNRPVVSSNRSVSMLSACSAGPLTFFGLASQGVRTPPSRSSLRGQGDPVGEKRAEWAP